MPFSVDMADPSIGDDVTLRLDATTSTLEIYDTANPAVGPLVSQKLNETDEVVVTGSDQDDRLTLDFETPYALPFGISFSGGLGTDTLAGADTDNTWTLTGADTGGLAGMASFSGIENLAGGGGQDVFAFSEGAAISGTIAGGGGVNTLDYSAMTTGVSVDLASGTASGTGGVSNLQNVTGGAGGDTLSGDGGANVLSGGSGDDVLSGGGGLDSFLGGAGSDTLVAGDGTNLWRITGLDSGTLNGASFSEIENLTGGAGDDTFMFLPGGSISGVIGGGGGLDRLDYSALSAGVSVNLAVEQANLTGAVRAVEDVTGGSGADSLIGDSGANLLAGGLGDDLLVGGGGADRVEGGAGSDTLVGPDGDTTWLISALDAGLAGGASFLGIENLLGGAGADNFGLADGAGVTGTIDGGDGEGTLDYSAYTTAVLVNLAVGVASRTGAVRGIQNVIGGRARDTLTGDDGANRLSGGDGDDILSGGGGADILTGGLGSDTLTGPAVNTTWNITGPNRGDVAGVSFSDIENLTGAAENQDSFVVAPGGSVDGVVDGGDAGFDRIVIGNGGYSQIIFTATAADSGSISLDGTVIEYVGLEPVDTTGTIGADLVFNLPGSDDHVELVDLGSGNFRLLSTDAIPTFEQHDFTDPSVVGSVTINLGAGSDSIILPDLSGLEAALTVNGGSGDDTIIVSGDSNITITDARLTQDGVSASIDDFQDAVLIVGTRDTELISDSFTGTVTTVSALNEVIDALLAWRFDPAADPTPTDRTFTTADPLVPDDIVVGQTPRSKADLQLENVTLTFSMLEYDSTNKRWDGLVGVEAPVATLFPDGGLGIEITDDDDADLNAVVGTINLDLGPDDVLKDVLKFDPLDAADLGWPAWLDIEITDLDLVFTDFRLDDTLSTLRLDGSFLGFDSGIEAVNELIGNFISVEGNVRGIEFDMDVLGAAEKLTDITENPILDISGISGEISGNLFGAAGLSAGFILKEITVDSKSVLYGAVRGSVSFGGFEVPGENGGESTTEGAFAFGLNFAISELGPLQFFTFVEAPIVLEPYSGLAISALRAGISFNTSIEDRQVRDPFEATEGSRTQTGLNPPEYTIDLTVPDHNLKVGDRFRITDAGNPNYISPLDAEDFIVDTVDGDNVSYRVTENPGAFSSFADVKKISISDPLDLRDPGFASTKDLSLSEWEAQLDQAVTDQILAAGGNVWDQLFAPVLIEGGAAMSFDPRIPDNVLGLEVDFLFDTELRLLLSGKMTLGGVVELPSKIFIDLSVIDGGPVRFLFLQEAPGVPDILQAQFPDLEPILVYRGGISFEILIDGLPASLDRTTGFPSGVGIGVSEGTVEDLSLPGPGPWGVTFKLDSVVTPSDKFAVGDSLVVVGSDPITFDGTHIVTAVNDAMGTVSFRIGTAVIDSAIDLNFDSIIDDLDDGLLGAIPVIAGLLDINRSGNVNEEDDGEVFSVITNQSGNRQVVAYKVIDGKVDVDGDGIVVMDTDDDGVIGEDPGDWVGDSLVANLNELGTGFQIILDGGIDLNIPFVTTLTLEGMATLDFLILPDPNVDEDLRVDLFFDASLSETNFGNIGAANGAFHATIDFDPVFQPDPELPVFEVWGAALLDTDFEFLEPVGLFAEADGLLRINSSGEEKPAERLTDVDNNQVDVALPANSFALRLEGSIDFRIDTSDFFTISGIFVLEFSEDQGFNVAIFDDLGGGMIGAATLGIGPAASPLLQVDVQGFLAIRGFTFAASLVLNYDSGLLDLARLEGLAVFIVNTTGQDVTFDIPGGGADPNRPTGLSLEIPRALPADPLAFFGGVDLQDLVDGRPWDLDPMTAGAVFGVLFLEGRLKLNIPATTMLTLQGKVAIDFAFPLVSRPPEDPDLVMNLAFDASLSETTFGTIGETIGAFHAAIDFSPLAQFELPDVQIWGAAILTTDIDFLEPIGLFVDAAGLLRINFTDTARAETLTDLNDNLITVELPAFSFALRLDGGVDFRIDFNGNGDFTTSESVFLISGIFVLEFSLDQGFNVAIFDDRGGMVGPATLALGPVSSPLLQVDVQGLLAIRNDGVAASLILSLDAGLPLGLASINAAAVFIVNTTGRVVTFDIPGGGTDPNRPTGLSLVIPKAAPVNPSLILGPPGSGPDHRFDDLKTGNPSWQEGVAGPYGILFLKGELELLSVFDLEVSGFVLLSPVVSLEVNFFAGGNFLNLASASARGTLFFSTQGEFELVADLSANINVLGLVDLKGSAHAEITYLDSDGKGSGGDGNRILNVFGSLAVELIFPDPFGFLNFTPPPIGIGYDGSSGAIFILVPVPVPAFAIPPWTFIDVRFNVAQLTINPPPPPVLGQVDVNGVLTLNVGPLAGARNLLVGEVNENVSIGRVGNDIQVTMFNVTQSFANVSRIEADMGDGTDFMEIQTPVTTPVEVRFGAGRDTLRHFGSGTVTAYGDGGNDRLEGGSANDRLFGGAGEDFIDGRGGQDWIEGGDDADILVGGVSRDTILGGRGEDLIAGDQAVVEGDASVAVFRTIASASGGDDVIQGGSGADIIFGGSGNDTITGDAGQDSLFGDDGEVTIQAGSQRTAMPLNLGSSGNDRMTWAVGDGNDNVIDGQGGTDTLDISGTSNPEQVTVSAAGAGFTAGIGAETLNVDGVEVSNIDGRQGSDTFTINDLTTSLLRQVNLRLGGDSVQDAVSVNGSSSGEAFNVDPIGNFLRVQKTGGVTVDIFDANTASGGDTITLDTLAGADIVNVRGTRAGTFTTVRTGAGADTINVGSLAPATGGTVDGIGGLLTVAGGGDFDTLNVDDTGDTDPNTGRLTATIITGLDMAGSITYGTIETLNINLGSLGDSFTIESTHAGTTRLDTNGGGDLVNVQTIDGATTVNAGNGDDVINVGTTDGKVDGIAALLAINGNDPTSGSDVLNVDDTGDTGPNTGRLTATTITGLDMAGSITYGTIETLNIGLGLGGDSFTIESTHTGTTRLDTNAGNDTVNVRTIDGETAVNTGADNDTVNVGSNASSTSNTGGNLRGIRAQLVIDGGEGSDLVDIDASGDTAGQVAILTPDGLTGLGMTGGIQYNGIEDLDLTLGAGNDIVNIRGTSATTDLNLGDGDDKVYVSSDANVDQTTQVGFDFLTGHLDDLQGNLNIDAGAGRHLLMVSDEASDVADTSVVITDQPVFGLPLEAEIAIAGLAAGAISYRANEDANFADGITVWTGSGNDNILVDGTHRRDGVRTTTTLNTGGGNDAVDVALTEGEDGFFVLNTQAGEDGVDASASSLPLIIFGGEDDDEITSGSGADMIFGDRGRVHYQDNWGDLVAALGNGGPGDFTDGIARDPSLLFTVNPAVVGNDRIQALNGFDIVFGGGGGDTINAYGTDVAGDILFGDHGQVVFDEHGFFIETTDPGGGGDEIIGGRGTSIVIGGDRDDAIIAGGDDSVRDIVLGDNGRAQFSEEGVLLFVETKDPIIGGDDVISAGNGPNVLLGGIDNDIIIGGGDEDIILGDNGGAFFNELGILLFIQATDPSFGDDLIQADNGADVVLGGGGRDEILAGGTDAARDIVVGDNGSAIFGDEGKLFQVTTQAGDFDDDDRISTGDGPDIILGGGGDRDIILAATGGDSADLGTVLNLIEAGNFDAIDPGDDAADIILGDNGIANFFEFTETPVLRDIQTSDPEHGGEDIIVGGNGPDVIFGGSDNDTIVAGVNAGVDDDAEDIVFGDNGRATFGGTESFDAGEETSVLSFNFNASSSSRTVTGAAGAVEIDGVPVGNWNNLTGDGPQTFGNDAGEIVVFDDGRIAPGMTIEWGEDLDTDPDDLSTDSHSQITPGDDQDLRLFEGYLHTSTKHTVGVNIAGLSGHFETYDLYVYLDADNGRSKSGTSVRSITDGSTTYYLDDADGNTFTGTYVRVDSTMAGAAQAGNYVVFEGLTGDVASIRIDDEGTSSANRPAITAVQVVGQSNPIDRIESTDPAFGGADIILTGGGADIVIGGSGADIIDTFGPAVRGKVDPDIVAGDNARATFMNGELREIRTTSPEIGGNDVIRTGNGADIVLGGIGDDDINTGVEDDSFDNGDLTVLSVNFNSGVDKGVVTGVAGAVQVDNWNNLVSQGSDDDDDDDDFRFTESATDLALDSGAATDISIEWGRNLDSRFARAADRDSHSQIDNPGTQNERLFEGYLHTSTSGTLGVDVTGLDAHFASYDVYVYIDADDSHSRSGQSLRSLTLGGATLLLDDPDGNTFAGEFVAATGGLGNYVVFRDVTGDAFSLRIDDQGSSSSNRPAISALQVVGGAGRGSVVLGGDFDTDAVVGDNGVARLFGGALYELATSDPTLGGDDSIATGEGSDLLIGGSGGDILDGAAGHDLLLGDNARLILFEGEIVGLDVDGGGDDDDDDDDDDDPGFDPFDVFGIQLLDGDIGGDDTLIGGTDDDLLYGQRGNDSFVFAGAGLGSDQVVEAGNGGPLANDPHDRLDFSAFDGPIDVDLGRSGIQTINGGSFEGDINLRIQLFSRTAIEGVTGSDFDDDIEGNSRNNSLLGRGGNDDIDGEYGDDLLLGGDGDDDINGGAGDDLIDGGAGADRLRGDGGDDDDDDDDGPFGRDVILGGAGNDYITGGRGDDLIDGEAGDDSISGGSGNDILLGGDGNDVIRGNSGGDILEGGLGIDLLFGNSGFDSVEQEVGAGQLGLADVFEQFAAEFELDGFMFSDPTGGVPGADDRPPRLWVQEFLDSFSLPWTSQMIKVALSAYTNGPGQITGAAVPVGVQAAAVTDAEGTLTEAELLPILDAAVRRFGAEGLMDGFDVRVADLPGLTLGQTLGNTILIDRDAAGHGWFVDPSPGDDSEFRRRVDADARQATKGSAAYGRMDLLTALMHEFGRVVGLDHLDGDGSDLMSASLATGVRLLPPVAVKASGAALIRTASSEPSNKQVQTRVFLEELNGFLGIDEARLLERLEVAMMDPDLDDDDPIRRFGSDTTSVLPVAQAVEADDEAAPPDSEPEDGSSPGGGLGSGLVSSPSVDWDANFSGFRLYG